MKLVVDSNILFTFFWEKSLTKKLFIKQELELLSPEFALEEINKYSEEIIKKTGISLKKFKDLRRELVILIEFIPLEEYSKFLNKILKFVPDKDDIDFFALALKFNCPIWSNDRILKEQSKIRIYSTEELIKLILS